MNSSPSHYFSPVATDWLDHDNAAHAAGERSVVVRAGGWKLEMRSGAGTFARDGLDAGSQLLVESFLEEFKTTSGVRLCDLGCGWGPVGCLLAKAFPDTSVFGCDINARAVFLARDNARRLLLPNAHFWCGDGLKSARPQLFDAILSNPPVRAGNAVIQSLFDDAFQTLQLNGQLWIVLRTAQGAKSWHKRLNAQFSNCRMIALQSGYRVLRCRR